MKDDDTTAIEDIDIDRAHNEGGKTIVGQNIPEAKGIMTRLYSIDMKMFPRIFATASLQSLMRVRTSDNAPFVRTTSAFYKQ